MEILFVILTPRHVVGSVLSQIDTANALARRGHRVHLGLAASGPEELPITSLDELRWIRLDPAIEVHLAGDDGAPERPDIVVGLALPGSLTVGFCRGASREGAFDHPWPIVCVSRWLVDHVASHGVEARRIVYVPNGVDHHIFRVSIPPRDRPAQVAMLYHPVPTKRVEDGIETMVALRRDRPGLRGVLFGAHDLVHDLPDWVTYHRLPDTATLVHDIYNGSQVFLCPSISEGFGRPSLEAMACGAALVTVDNGGSRDFAVDEQTAMVVPAHDVPAMTAAAGHLLDEHRFREQLVRRGVARAHEFDWGRTAARLEEFFLDYRADPARFVDRGFAQQFVPSSKDA